MGLEALGHIGEVLNAVGNEREEVMMFSPATRPGRGSRNGAAAQRGVGSSDDATEQRAEEWKDLVNVRYRQDGYRQDIFLRGGTRLVDELGGGDIVQVTAFSASIDGTAMDYLAVKKTDGFVLFDIDAGSPEAVFGSVFNGDHRVWIEPIGRFLFVFDPVNNMHRYLDLKTMDEHTWLGATSPNVTALGLITTGDFKEGNIWGFREGGRVICLDQVFERQGVFLPATETLAGGPRTWYAYTYNGGKFITVNGTDYKANSLFQLPGAAALEYNGGGADATLDVLHINAVQNGAIDFSPHLGTINEIEPAGLEPAAAKSELWTVTDPPSGDGSVTVAYPFGEPSEESVNIPYLESDSIEDVVIKVVNGVNADEEIEITAIAADTPSTKVEFTEKRTGEEFNGNIVRIIYPHAASDISDVEMSGGTSGGTLITVNQRYDTPVNSQVNENGTLILPRSTDVMPLLEAPGKFVPTDFDVEEAEQFRIPVLSRAYLVLYELNDGSYTVPGCPQAVSLPVNEILSGNEFLVRGISLELSGAPPSSAVKLHLFATKWQLETENCFAPSESYPNGAFYHASEHDPDTEDIDDFTADDALLNPLNGFLPMVNAVYTLFRAGELEPRTVMRSGDVFAFGGYTIQRPDSFAQHALVTSEGAVQADLSIGLVYEYTDKTLGDFVLHAGDVQEENTLILHGLNGLVAGVHVYLLDVPEDEYYLVKTVRPGMPQFYGLPMDIPGETAGFEEVPDPAGDQANARVTLAGFVALATPPNTARIDNQFNLSGVKTIRALLDTGLDEDRGAVVRRRFTALTDRAPVQGIITLAQGRFFVDSEAGELDAPVTNPFAGLAMGRTVFFPGPAGLYVMDRTAVRLFVPADRYPVLSGPILDIVFHERHGELWVLGENNRVLSIPLRDDLQASPRMAEIEWPTTDARTCRAFAAMAGRLFTGFDASLYEADQEGWPTDGIHTAGPLPPVTGSLTSDHLSNWQTQLYLAYVEAYGEWYGIEIFTDLQSGRFDSGGPWTQEFQKDVATGKYSLSMRGGERAILGRGFAPRLRVELHANIEFPGAGKGRLSGLKLAYEVVEGRR